MVRSSAEITPTDSDWRSPNGLPMAATGCAHDQVVGCCPARSGVSFRPGRVDLEQRDVGVGVVAHDPRLHAVAVGELHVDLLGALAVRRLAAGDHVGVGGHVALAVDHEPGALTTLALVLVEQRARPAVEQRHDRDHAR